MITITCVMSWKIDFRGGWQYRLAFGDGGREAVNWIALAEAKKPANKKSSSKMDLTEKYLHGDEGRFTL